VRLSFDIDSKVAEIMQGARNLPMISDAGVDNDFEVDLEGNRVLFTLDSVSS
jgi:hypothetical protein